MSTSSSCRRTRCRTEMASWAPWWRASRSGVAGVTARAAPRGRRRPDGANGPRGPEASAEADERGGDGAPSIGLDGPARAHRMRFNDVASCMSRATLLEHPLPEVPFGEDAAWARRCSAGGLRVRHEPGAIVRHAHRYGPSSAWRRYAQDAAFHRSFHGFRVRPHLGSVLKGWAYEVATSATSRAVGLAQPPARAAAPTLPDPRAILRRPSRRRCLVGRPA